MSRPQLQLLGAALLFSTGGAAIKACGMGPFAVASFRSLVAALAILLLVPASRRAWSLRICAVACSYAITLGLFVIANRLTTAAHTIFLQSTAPVYVLLLSPWLLKEPLQRRDAAVLVLLIGGMLLFFVGQPDQSSMATDPWLGNLLAGCAGFTWALTLLGLRHLSREDAAGAGSGAAAAALGSLISGLVCLAFVGSFQASVVDWLWIIYLGVLQVGLAYALLTRGMPRVPAFEASLLLMVEPILSPFWAYLLHGEQPGGWALLGATVVTCGLLLRLRR